MDVLVVHITDGQKAPSYDRPEERLTLETLMADMFHRLLAGAAVQIRDSGTYNLVQRGHEQDWQWCDIIVYCGLPQQLQSFLYHVADWIEDGTREREAADAEGYLRWYLIRATQHWQITNEQLKAAYSMSLGDFFAAIALAVECSQDVSTLFEPR